MRLTRLQLTNFRLHADTRIEFDSGLTGIIGPNGAGKTTILEAIAWALYGVAALRGRKKQDVRSLRASGRAAVRVELDFELAGHGYRVVRTLSSAELYLDGGAAPIANSTSGVTDLLRRRLGMTQQEFFNTYFTGQKQLGAMAAMAPADRAQFLSRVLGYERLRAAQGLIRVRRNELRGEIAGVQSAMPDSESVARAVRETTENVEVAEQAAKAALAVLKKTSAAVAKVTPLWAKAQQQREAAHQAASELRVVDAELAGLDGDVERLRAELTTIVAAREQAAAIRDELALHRDVEAQLHEMNRLFQEEGKRRALQQNRGTIEKELARSRERIAALSTASATLEHAEQESRRQRNEIEATSAALRAANDDWVRDQQEALTRRDQLRAQYKDVEAQRERLATLGPDSPCPICTRPLADHFREVLDELDGKLDEIRVEGQYFAARVEQLADAPSPVRELQDQLGEMEHRFVAATRAVSDAQLREQERSQVAREVAEREGRLVAIEAELVSVPTGYHATRHATLRQQLSELAPLVEQAAKLSALTEREPHVRKALDRAAAAAAAARDRSTRLRATLSSVKFDETAFSATKARFDAASSEQHAAELAALGAEKELDAARAARAVADVMRKELERTRGTLRGLTLGRRMHDELDHAFTDVRAGLNERLRPEVSELASGFLADLTDGRYTDLELDDEYNIIVKEDDVPKPVISGGEEDLAHLVLRLAISQMIAERAGQAFSLLVLDEVFGSLDEARRHNVVELLRRLHDRFDQVIVITHIESVREGLDRVLNVRYDEDAGVARVQQESGAGGDETLADAYAAALAVGTG